MFQTFIPFYKKMQAILVFFVPISPKDWLYIRMLICVLMLFMFIKCYAPHHHKNNNKTKASVVALAVVLVIVVAFKMSPDEILLCHFLFYFSHKLLFSKWLFCLKFVELGKMN